MQVILIGAGLVLLNTFGQLLLKKAAGQGGYKNKYLWFGYVLFLLAITVSYFLMQYVELKYFTVVMSLNYLSVLMASAVFLGEGLNRIKVTGTFLLLAGVVLFMGDKF